VRPTCGTCGFYAPVIYCNCSRQESTTTTTVRVRTLITQREYFGMDAIALRAATARVLARVAGLPPGEAQVSARSLHQDFAVDTVIGSNLVHELVADGLLEADGETEDEYRITGRFLEYATARVVDPLPRERARNLVYRASELAQYINDQWTRNPLQIELVAPFGTYMSRDRELAELALGIVVAVRAPERRARWGRILARRDGAREMRNAFRALSSFVHVKMVSDVARLPRPFSVVFEQR
jgi:hypothetical protein